MPWLSQNLGVYNIDKREIKVRGSLILVTNNEENNG